MKRINLFPVLALAAAPAFLHAQTNFSDIVGYQSKSIPVGLSTVGVSLLNPDILKSTATSLAGNVLTVSGQSNVGGLLTSGEPYYIEVYSGSLKGDRFDVDTAATISAANGTLILNGSSANNTFAVGSIGTGLNSQTVALRKHVTLSQIQGMCSPALAGNNNSALADQILVFANGTFVTYSLRGGNLEWRKSGETVNYAKLAIPPGSGIMLSKRGSATTLTETGGVRQNDFAVPMIRGLQFMAPSVPTDRSVASFGMVPNTNGWVGNNNSALADQLLVFSGGSFVTYSLRADGQLRKSGDTTDYKLANLLSSGSAYIFKRNNANADLVESQVVPSN